jgi:Arc/MetJ-type ribon-helix-helix transcriptional regulator
LKERITVRMTSEMIARIDAWIAHQPGYVSRQDAVRHCVDLILGQSTHERGLCSASGATKRDSDKVCDAGIGANSVKWHRQTDLMTYGAREGS